MFLIDTNCFIQIARLRPEAPQVQAMLDGIPQSQLFVSDFTLHSIGVIMSRFGQIDGYVAFVRGLGIGKDLSVLRIETGDIDRIAAACKDHALDFDDAYQYALAELHGLTIVSLDSDFDRTPRGRLVPTAALNRFKAEQ